jgi:hypothetical protein
MGIMRRMLVFTMFVVAILPSRASCSQPLETESARLARHGRFAIELGVERQTSSAGTETALPLAFEYGISDRLELVVEPVPFTLIHDKGVAKQSGPGDLEATLTALVAAERAARPAFAVAGEFKAPTARNARIGTGKSDLSGYLIASKHIGRWDAHADVGYTIVGRPARIAVNNTVSFAVAGELHATRRLDFVGEAFGSTGAIPESHGGLLSGVESPTTPELGGGELVGQIGLRLHATGHLTYALGVSVDNNAAVLVHPGLTLAW